MFEEDRRVCVVVAVGMGVGFNYERQGRIPVIGKAARKLYSDLLREHLTTAAILILTCFVEYITNKICTLRNETCL